jgi:hypothetical protein
MTRSNFLALAAVCMFGATGQAFAEASTEALVDSGNRLAALLRAGRSVVSENQALINDATVGDKGLTPEVFLDEAMAIYEARNGEPPLSPGLTATQIQLTFAQLAAMSEVIAEAQGQINAKGIGFKGFIPATFARLTNERFGDKVGDLARVKVTAPQELVRNRKALPDDWEQAVIEGRFMDPDWEKGGSFYEMTEGAEGPMFRMLIPEYYTASCLSCHGMPKGEIDVTGFPKEGSAVGDLGGAISIMLKP